MAFTRRRFGIMAGLAILLAIPLAGSLVIAQHEHDTSVAPDQHGAVTAGTPARHDTHGDIGATGTGVVYLTITNTGDGDDALVSASTGRARDVSVHETVIEDGIGRMMPVEGALTIPAGESVALEPGGLHLMLVGLNDDIRLDDTFRLTLVFDDAGEVTVPVTAVFDAAAAGSTPVTAGDLVIADIWSRPAPKIDGVIATPAT